MLLPQPEHWARIFMMMGYRSSRGVMTALLEELGPDSFGSLFEGYARRDGKILGGTPPGAERLGAFMEVRRAARGARLPCGKYP